ncbi:MAG: nicotinate (nicotinamide) nucleotide adenylyltransferase [Clostridiales bacterium]|nr:nicotinate (nicotinamide) nucleotide adenylyltransferase [Clostridiales bacterium]
MCNNKYMERIGIFGGTFNPVHTEHVEIVRHAIEELKLDRLIVMPTFIAPHKTDIPLPAQDRINMLKIAFKDFDKVEVSDFEILNGGKSYTYLTVEHFKKTLNAHLFFICGGDMLTNFKTWRYPERILAACDLAAFGREDFFTDYSAEKALFLERFNKSFIQLKYIGKNFSSTKIRIYSAFNLALENLVPKGVEEYIKQNNLYEGDFYTKFICANLPPKRVLHTANVVIAALRKAKELGLDKGKVMLAATLHDCAKYIDYKALDGFVLPSGVPEPVIHSFLGAYFAEHRLGVTDSEVLDAIRYHTSGKPNMTTLGKLIFVADMVEEGRNYDGVEYLRALYEKQDFEFCFKECLREEMLHLQNKGQPIYEQTINAFNYYCK